MQHKESILLIIAVPSPPHGGWGIPRNSLTSTLSSDLNPIDLFKNKRTVISKLMLIDYFYVQLRSSVRVAMPLEHTQEAIMLTRGEICNIPGVAPAILGVVNQQGRLLWVLELSDLLRLPPSGKKSQPQDSLPSILITARSPNEPIGTIQLACVVTALQGIVSLNAESFKPLPAKIPPAVKDFFTGVAEIENAPVAVLNVKAVFATVQAEKVTDNVQ